MGIRIHKDWAFYAPFQFFWILVILPKALQLVCLGGLMLLCAFRSGREKPLDKFSILQLVFMLIYGVAIVVNALGGDHDMKRIFADMYGDKGYCPARKVDVIDTTGAGDSFCAGVAIGLTYGKSLAQACDIGAMLAASVIVTTESVCPRFLPRELGLDRDVED